MSEWLNMTRRRCLALIAGSLAAISWPLPGSAADLLRGKQAARWRRQLRSPGSAAIVGTAYLAVHAQAVGELIDDLETGPTRTRRCWQSRDS